MPFKRKIVQDLGEYMNVISEIAGTDCQKPPILWFRGLDNVRHSLIPSLYRKKVRADRTQNYTKLHYAEDIRTQHYIAKNYHLLSSEPSSRVEWLEVMQHHQVNTRVLDWSESSIHSLIFAVEAFFDAGRFADKKRMECVPCVWVLNPKKLNRKIIKYIAQNEELKKKLLADLELTFQERERILNQMNVYADLTEYAETTETSHIDYIFNLSSINDEIFRDRVRLKKLLEKGAVINPYYYLLSRIYSDGYCLSGRILPPLCVVHPYHSERIKAQKGVFSVFPFYREQEDDQYLRKYQLNPDAMDHNSMAQDCLCQIMIKNPQKIVLQLMENGMNESWLYPEMPIVSSEIENHMVV